MTTTSTLPANQAAAKLDRTEITHAEFYILGTRYAAVMAKDHDLTRDQQRMVEAIAHVTWNGYRDHGALDFCGTAATIDAEYNRLAKQQGRASKVKRKPPTKHALSRRRSTKRAEKWHSISSSERTCDTLRAAVVKAEAVQKSPPGPGHSRTPLYTLNNAVEHFFSAHIADDIADDIARKSTTYLQAKVVPPLRGGTTTTREAGDAPVRGEGRGTDIFLSRLARRFVKVFGKDEELLPEVLSIQVKKLLSTYSLETISSATRWWLDNLTPEKRSALSGHAGAQLYVSLPHLIVRYLKQKDEAEVAAAESERLAEARQAAWLADKPRRDAADAQAELDQAQYELDQEVQRQERAEAAAELKREAEAKAVAEQELAVRHSGLVGRQFMVTGERPSDCPDGEIVTVSKYLPRERFRITWPNSAEWRAQWPGHQPVSWWTCERAYAAIESGAWQAIGADDIAQVSLAEC